MKKAKILFSLMFSCALHAMDAEIALTSADECHTSIKAEISNPYNAANFLAWPQGLKANVNGVEASNSVQKITVVATRLKHVSGVIAPYYDCSHRTTLDSQCRYFPCSAPEQCWNFFLELYEKQKNESLVENQKQESK